MIGALIPLPMSCETCDRTGARDGEIHLQLESPAVLVIVGHEQNAAPGARDRVPHGESRSNNEEIVPLVLLATSPI